MSETIDPSHDILDQLRERMGDAADGLVLPPPVFVAMRGEFVAADLAAESLTTLFFYLALEGAAFGAMQGGMVAAAIDNTVGPLSLLVAPGSVTRRMEVKYRRVASPDMGHIVVTAKLHERKKRHLIFEASVRDPTGTELANAKSTHWILDQS